MKQILLGFTCFLAGLITAVGITSHATDFYFTAGIGQASLNHPGDNKWFIQKGWDYEIDEKSNAYRVGIGAKFSKYLSLEANYHDFGKYKMAAAFMMQEDDYNPDSPTLCHGTCEPTTWAYISGKAHAISFSILPSYPITNKLSVYARVGAAYFNAQFDARFSQQDSHARSWTYVSMTSKGWTPMYGGGIKYGNWSLDAIQMPYVRVTGNNGDCCGPYTSATAYTINYSWEIR